MAIDCVVNTRPTPVVDITNRIIENHGFKAFSFPLIDIEYLDFSEEIEASNDFQQSDVVIFTSQFAVVSFFQSHAIPLQAQCIAVGQKTAEAIESHSSHTVWIPQKQTSEGMIELLSGFKQVRAVSVIGGVGGRREIEKWAAKNHIRYRKIEVYRRKVANHSEKRKSELTELQNPAFLITSVSSLEALHQNLNSAQWLWALQQKAVCVSARIAEKAADMGFKKLLNADSADMDDLLVALKQNEPQSEAR